MSRLGEQRCPYPIGNRQRASWLAEYEAAVWGDLIDEDNTFTRSEAFEFIGWDDTRERRSLNERTVAYGPPPKPVATIFRTLFYDADEIREWIKPRCDRIADVEARKRARVERSDRWAQRLALPGQVGPSGYRNVRKQRNHDSWRAYITADGVTQTIGNYRTAEEAALAVDHARNLLGFPSINFPGRDNTHVPVFERGRAVGCIARTVELIRERGAPISADDLWDISRGWDPEARWLTRESMTVGLHVTKKIRRVGRCLYDLAEEVAS
jgi:hypothetical protein